MKMLKFITKWSKQIVKNVFFQIFETDFTMIMNDSFRLNSTLVECFACERDNRNISRYFRLIKEMLEYNSNVYLVHEICLYGLIVEHLSSNFAFE